MSKTETPSIRFCGFGDAWEQRKFSDVVATRRGLTYKPSDIRKNGVRVLRSSNIAEDSFALSDEDVFVVREAVNIDCARANDILITAANGSSRLVGKHTIISGIPEESAVHGGFMILGTTKEPHFVNASMGSSWYRRFIELFVAGGNGAIGNLNKNDLDNQEIAIPSEEEQKKIGSFFRQLDDLITLHQRKVEKLTNVKKSMLEKMFPQNGSCYPAVRFKGFTGPWERRKFGDVFEEYSEKNRADLPPLTIIQGSGTIRRDESERALQYDKASLSNYKVVNEGDLIVHLRSFEGGLEKANSQGIISPAYHTFHGEGVDSRFYYTYFRSKNFIDTDLKPHVYGIRDGRSIDIEGMKTIEIPFTSYPEQKLIGDAIDSINTLISLQRRELEKLQSIKKSLLEKMFV